MEALWNVVQDGYDQREIGKYETLFTLANGYRGIRGSIAFSEKGERGNYIAGVFDKGPAQVTELVNCPNPLGIKFYLDDEKVDMDKCSISLFKRLLNMKEGILYTMLDVETKSGRKASITCERMVSRNNVHRWAEKYTIVAFHCEKLVVESLIDGTVSNRGSVAGERVKHFKIKRLDDLNPGISLTAETIDKGLEIVEQTVIKPGESGKDLLKHRVYGETGCIVSEAYHGLANGGKKYVFYKLGCTYTSRDNEKDIFELCRIDIANFFDEGYEDEKEKHVSKWHNIWDGIDIKITGDDKAQLGIRNSLFHLSSAAYDGDGHVSIGAKGLHGEGYRGHVFWDTEIFMLPFFIYTNPAVARSLMMYRYNTLKGARENAVQTNCSGARFPWESAEDGREVTPKWITDIHGSLLRVWSGEEECHINSDIAYAVWEYFRATCDMDFLINYGMEIILEISKCWESMLKYNEECCRYEIKCVIGPDEFHEHVDNNAYTNYLAGWTLKKSAELMGFIKREKPSAYEELCARLCLDEETFKRWNMIGKKIFIPASDGGKLIEQFEGYFGLRDIPIVKYDDNGMPMWPELDGLKLNDTQLVKQADVVMLMVMIREEFDEEARRENYRYYEKRTMHKSSLSPSMYSIMGLSVGDTEKSYSYFMKTIMTDMEDNQGNAGDGLHAASAGGSWQCAVFGFGGFSIDSEMVPNINPWIPQHWRELRFRINWRGNIITIAVRHHMISVHSSGDVEIKVYGKRYKIDGDKQIIYDNEGEAVWKGNL